jgi:hypothetical protein
VSGSAPLSLCLGRFLAGRGRAAAGVSARRCRFLLCRGRRGMRVGCGARSAPSGGVGREGGVGGTGDRAVGGPGFPPRCLQASTSRRRAAVGSYAAR